MASGGERRGRIQLEIHIQSTSPLATHHSPLQILLPEASEDDGDRLTGVLAQQLQDFRTVISVDSRDRRKLDRAQYASVHLKLVARLNADSPNHQPGEDGKHGLQVSTRRVPTPWRARAPSLHRHQDNRAIQYK